MDQRFWSKVEMTEGCWLWTAGLNTGGYGQFHLLGSGANRVRILAHRYAYEMLIGPVPEGLDLDHLCRERRCVRADHLEPVTRRENLLRGETIVAHQAQQTHCLRGHALADAYVTSRGKRQCKQCRQITANSRAEHAESRR